MFVVILMVAALQAPIERQLGTLQGIVTTAGTNQPLPGVKVRLSGGPTDPQAMQKLLGFFASRGVVVNPPSGQPDDRFFQNLRDTAAARGLSLVNPEVQNALMTFQMANDSRFTAVSDATGRFMIRSIPPGRYVVAGDRDDAGDSAVPSVASVSACQSSPQRAQRRLQTHAARPPPGIVLLLSQTRRSGPAAPPVEVLL